MALPRPAFGTPAEPFAAAWSELICEPTPKPGVLMFRDFVVAHQGGGEGLIGRDCATAPSGHYAGRAWDWMISALDPDEKARADELIAWLLENDAEIFRRAGLRYIIWDKKFWGTFERRWKPYDGYDAQGACPSGSCRNPHIDHVHFSFGIDGSDGKGSFYDWLRQGMPTDTVPPPGTKPPRSPWSVGLAVLGFGVGYVGIRRFVGRRRGTARQRMGF